MKKFIIVGTLLALSGCYSVTINRISPDGSPGVTESKYVHSLIYGLVSLNEIDASAICGSAGVFKVQTKHSIVTGLVNFLTGGIYTPVVARITCRA